MWIVSLIAALAAPATVIEHRLDVRIDYGQRLSTTQTWTVRIDDPAACVAGLLAPPGLDGAESDGALVLQDLLVVPEDTVAGQEFTLTRTDKAGRASHSGRFQTAPDLPVVHAEVRIESQGRQPLTVWADPTGDPVWSTRRGKSAVITWDDIPVQSAGRATWSTWRDWEAAGVALENTVDQKIATKAQLGRDLAADVGSSNLPELARRTFQMIELDPTIPGTFATSRTAAKVASAKMGTAAERGIVLISMLRAAGYKASPAMLREATSVGGLPITVPSPEMLDIPVVYAEDRSGVPVWIDPGSNAIAVPAMPARLIGATVWIPGDLPTNRVPPSVTDGTVTVATTGKIDPKGNVNWSSSIVADGTALEAFRTLLQPLGSDDQQKALERLVRQGRPELERFSMSASGTTDPFKNFTLTLNGIDQATFQPWGQGVQGVFQPVLGSALLAWLPPNIKVREVVDVSSPQGLKLLAVHTPKAAYDPDGQLDWNGSSKDNRATLDVQGVRPYASTTSARDAGAARFFQSQAQLGMEVTFLPPTTKASVKATRALDLPAPQIAALQSSMWWNANLPKPAAKSLKKAVKVHGIDGMAGALSDWTAPGSNAPWQSLFGLAETPVSKLTVLNAMQPTHPKLASELATPLMQNADPTVAVPALLIGMAHRPQQEWRNSLASRIDNLPDAAMQQRGRLAVAAFDVDVGTDPVQATKDISTDTLLGDMLTLSAQAKTMPRAALREEIDRRVAKAPDDPEIARRAGRLYLAAGDADSALESSLRAARLSNGDGRLWNEVAVSAMHAGNLRLALQAVRQAFSLSPDDDVIATHAHHLAVLGSDEALESSARGPANQKKPQTWPPTLDSLMEQTLQHEILAVLQHDSVDVESNPIYLALRAQLRTDAGLRDEAARDSIRLQSEHGDTQGQALAFSATVGRVFGTGALSLLSDVRDETARLTRMDYRLITSSGDPRSDARILREQPRAQEVLLVAGSPAESASKTAGWPEGLSDRAHRAPKGYRANAVLSSVAGVTAYSHVDRQLAVIYVEAATEVLPPPLSSLYSRQTPALEQLDDGTLLFALRDGYLPLYTARRTETDQTVYGLGFTPQAAIRALDDAR